MKLEQIAQINTGHPFRGKIHEAAGSALMAVQMKDISPTQGICWSSCIETELTGKSGSYLKTGDILIAARGSHNYAVQVDNSLAATGKQAVAAPHFFVIKLSEKNALPEFITWLLNQKRTQRYFKQSAEGTLTKSIRINVLKDTPVIVPTIAKQQAIIKMANTLSKEKILAQQLVESGERIMSAVAKDLFKSQEASL